MDFILAGIGLDRLLPAKGKGGGSATTSTMLVHWVVKVSLNVYKV